MACTGEIDIMGTLHYPGRSGGDTKDLSNACSEFHIYTVKWSPERIWFLVDNEVYHMYENTRDSVFNKDFFLILKLLWVVPLEVILVPLSENLPWKLITSGVYK